MFQLAILEGQIVSTKETRTSSPISHICTNVCLWCRQLYDNVYWCSLHLESFFSIFCKHFLENFLKACHPFGPSSPSAPIKAVFLQLMKTVTMSSWSRVTQGLHGRWFVQEYMLREKAARRKTNKDKNGSLLPVKVTYFLPNTTMCHFQIFKLSAKMLSSLETWEEFFFLFNFFPPK